MKGSQKVLDGLNDLLTSELTAVNQYMVHHHMCDDWGYVSLANYFGAEANDERGHVGKIITRLLFLEGSPDVQSLGKIDIGKDAKAQIELMLKTETSSVVKLNDLMKVARDEGDNGTREMLEGLLVDTEHAVLWAESQLHVIKQIGIELYLSRSISIGGSANG